MSIRDRIPFFKPVLNAEILLIMQISVIPQRQF